MANAPPLRRLQAFDGDLPIADAEAAAEDGREDPLQPKLGDKIMVVHQPWLDYILDGSKTMELRARKYKSGFVWVGMAGTIYGKVKIVGAVALSAEEFRAQAAKHRWPGDQDMPYKSPWGLILEEPLRLPVPIPYWRPGSAIGWNIYRTQESDIPMRTTSHGNTKKRPKKSEDAAEASGAANSSEP